MSYSQHFEHGRSYKIRSVVDGTLLDLHGANTAQETIIKTEQPNGNGAQIWVANREGHGFRLESSLNPPRRAVMVIDAAWSRNFEGIYYELNGGTNQQFFTEVVSSNGGKHVVLIKTHESDRAMRNQGRGRQVKFVSADKFDVSQQWTLESAKEACSIN